MSHRATPTVSWSTATQSYQLTEVQHLFRFLSVFAGGCQLSAVEAIIQAADLAESHVLYGVSALLECQLVCDLDL